MPWKDQFRLGWKILRWVFWPENQRAWANAADVVLIVAIVVAIRAQVWLGLLAGFFLWFAVGFAGRKRDAS